MNLVKDAPFVAPAPTDAGRAAATALGSAQAHESAQLHVTGSAAYVDDLPELAGTLHAALGLSALAHGRLGAIALEALRALPGVVDVISADDIPGRNDCGPIVHDDPILADGVVHYLGQPVFAVLAETRDAARRAAARARRIPGIAAHAEEPTVGDALPAELAHGGLAEEHGAGLAQPRDVE